MNYLDEAKQRWEEQEDHNDKDLMVIQTLTMIAQADALAGVFDQLDRLEQIMRDINTYGIGTRGT